MSRKDIIMPTRTTIYIDEALLERARRYIPTRGLSQFLNELLSERLTELERAEIEAQMRDGYIATRRERRELNTEWQTIDGEEWPA